jgi:hypothetical protein
MRKSLLVVASALAATLSVTASAQRVVPVRFATGASAATVTGSITGQAYTDYRVNVRAGQLLSVSLTRLGGSPYFNVMEPGSTGLALYDGSSAIGPFRAETRRSGDYIVRVYQMRATARRGETARFRLTVGVTGGAGAKNGTTPSHQSGDALVPGTPYQATTTIRCRTTPGAALGSCKAGVIRRTGSATVHIDTPDGGERTILFRRLDPVSSDSQAGLVATRRGEVSVVRIGTVEVYEIPDPLIEGG